jgi:glycosyltransferase involved in cell wall biosynthesis
MSKDMSVSVVLGTYNGEAYLREQLDSIFEQTHFPQEIIAVDDCSTDGTVAILHEYAARTPRMKVIVNEQNLGFIRNFEKGCSLAKSRWIALCDQDDYWMPEKIERMVEAIGDQPMAYCDSLLCDKDLQPLGNRISDLVHNQSFDDPRQLCVFSRMYGHATLITRGLFERCRPFLPEMPHDGWLAYHATLYGGVHYLPEVLVKYRQHAANVYGVVGGKRKNPNAEEKALRKKKELARVRIRMQAYCDACPESMVGQKKLLRALAGCYRDFTPWNDLRRMLLFFANYKYLLVVKKYSTVRKWLFCLKMLVKIK